MYANTTFRHFQNFQSYIGLFSASFEGILNSTSDGACGDVMFL